MGSCKLSWVVCTRCRLVSSSFAGAGGQEHRQVTDSEDSRQPSRTSPPSLSNSHLVMTSTVAAIRPSSPPAPLGSSPLGSSSQPEILRQSPNRILVCLPRALVRASSIRSLRGSTPDTGRTLAGSRVRIRTSVMNRDPDQDNRFKTRDPSHPRTFHHANLHNLHGQYKSPQLRPLRPQPDQTSGSSCSGMAELSSLSRAGTLRTVSCSNSETLRKNKD